MEDVKEYLIGDLTFELVFKRSGITDLHDLQVVLDAVELAFQELKND